jgi:hypothetical protein
MRILKFLSAIAVAGITALSAMAQGTASYNNLNVQQTLTLPGGTTITASGGTLYVSSLQPFHFGGQVSVYGQLAWTDGGSFITDVTGSPIWYMPGDLTIQSPELIMSPLGGGEARLTTGVTNGGLELLGNGTGFLYIASGGNVTIASSGNQVLLSASGSDTNLGIVLGATNAYETLGDTFYVGGTNPNESTYRLPGNTGTRRQYLSQKGTGSSSAAPAWVNGPVYNVADYGIVPDGSTDWSSSLNSIIAAAPAGSVFYFPPSGTGSGDYYRVDGLSATTADIALTGDADSTTLIETQSTTAPIFQSTAGNVSITNLNFQSVNSRAYGYPLISIAGASRSITISNVQTRCTGDAWVFGSSTGFLEMNNVNSKTLSPGGCVVQFSSGNFTNCDFNNTSNGRPAMLQVGTSSGGTQIANCEIQGGGPQYSYNSSTVSSIGSNGSFITVDMSNTTGINPGTWVVLSGMTTTAYNGFYRATTVAANTYLGLTPIGPPFCAIPSSGTCTIGTGVVETVPGCLVIAGDVSQSQISNVMFEGPSGGYPSDPLSAGVFIDGTQNSSGVSNGDVGEQFTGCYYDWGKVGALILGGGTNGSTLNTGRIEFTGGQILSNNTYTGLGGVWISKAPGVKVHGLQSTALNIGTTNSTWIYIYSDSSIISDGCEIQNCAMGSTWWNGVSYTTYVPQYAITIDGSSNSVALNALGFSGNMAWGQTAVTNILNGGVTSSTVIYGGGNGYFTGTSNPPTHAATPTYFP